MSGFRLNRMIVLVVVLGAIAVGGLLYLRSNGHPGIEPQAKGVAGPGSDTPDNGGPQEVVPPTSEALIAEALAAGEISYETSLLQRAYAVFDDPRLQRSFRTKIVNWEAIGPLLDEIAAKEATLSTDLLESLRPFRVRPNDPASIINRPREEVVKTAAAATPPWVGLPVPDSNLMVWIQGTEADLQDYVGIAGSIWKAFPPFFTYPLPDQPGRAVGFFNNAAVNPNNRVDVYLIDGATVDPRLGQCDDCSLAGKGAWTKVDPEARGAHTSSAYLLIDKTKRADFPDTLAHELAHASQLAYDTTETGPGAEGWMVESTATYVAYKVMTALNTRPAWEYRLIDRREPSSNPRWPAPPLMNNLHQVLHRHGNNYSGFLFFASASMDLGDGIVKQVWQQAAARGPQGIDAVNAAIPLADHFPRFTVRNWNQDPVRLQYHEHDGAFSRSLRPEPVRNMPDDLGRFELSDPVVNLSARYYRFKWSGPRVKKVTFQNFYQDVADAHVWAIKQIGTDWKAPEDWSRREQVELCRESPDENVTELVLIVSDSHPRLPLDAGHPKPRLLVEDVGCEFIEGSAQSMLRLRDDSQDLTYVSSRTTLRFRPRMMQDTPGKVDYDLLPASTTWTVSGTRRGCRVSGQMIVSIPAYLDQPLDPSRPAFGYMAVIGLDGGDFHSVSVSAFDPGAQMKVTCPGQPPSVHGEPFDSTWLVHVLHEHNSHANGIALFTGSQTLDAARIGDNIPVGPGQALSILQNAPPNIAGLLTPEARRALQQAQETLNRDAAENSGKLVYTFDWELKPMSGTPGP